MHATNANVYRFATDAEEVSGTGEFATPLRREARLQPRIENLFAELVVAALEELAAVVEGHRRARPRRHDLAVINAAVRCAPAEASSLVEQRYARAGSKRASVVAATIPVMPPPTIATSGCITASGSIDATSNCNL